MTMQTFHAFQNKQRILVCLTVDECRNDLLPYVYKHVPQMHTLVLASVQLGYSPDKEIRNYRVHENKLIPATLKADDECQAMADALTLRVRHVLLCSRQMLFKTRQFVGSYDQDLVADRIALALKADAENAYLSEPQKTIVAIMHYKYHTKDSAAIWRILEEERALNLVRLDQEIAKYMDDMHLW